MLQTPKVIKIWSQFFKQEKVMKICSYHIIRYGNTSMNIDLYKVILYIKYVYTLVQICRKLTKEVTFEEKP